MSDLFGNYIVGFPTRRLISDVEVECFQKKFCTLSILLDTTPEFSLTHLSLASLLWDIGEQNSPRCDATERGVPSGAILFA